MPRYQNSLEPEVAVEEAAAQEVVTAGTVVETVAQVATIPVILLHPKPRDGAFLIRVQGSRDARKISAELVPVDRATGRHVRSFSVPQDVYDSLPNYRA